jgi:hypothetical protein
LYGYLFRRVRQHKHETATRHRSRCIGREARRAGRDWTNTEADRVEMKEAQSRFRRVKSASSRMPVPAAAPRENDRILDGEVDRAAQGCQQ